MQTKTLFKYYWIHCINMPWFQCPQVLPLSILYWNVQLHQTQCTGDQYPATLMSSLLAKAIPSWYLRDVEQIEPPNEHWVSLHQSYSVWARYSSIRKFSLNFCNAELNCYEAHMLGKKQEIAWNYKTLTQCSLIIKQPSTHTIYSSTSRVGYNIYDTRPIVSRGWRFCLWIALGQFMFDNEYSITIHALCYTDPAWLSLTNERIFVDQQQQINER